MGLNKVRIKPQRVKKDSKQTELKTIEQELADIMGGSLIRENNKSSNE